MFIHTPNEKDPRNLECNSKSEGLLYIVVKVLGFEVLGFEVLRF